MKALIGILVVALLVAGCTQPQPPATGIQESAVAQTTGGVVENPANPVGTTITVEKPAATDSEEQGTETIVEETAAQPAVREFDVHLKRFSFEPSRITVKKGETVKLNITADDTEHGFFLAEFGVNVRPSVGETKSVKFVADKAGSFSFRCNVFCGSGHASMTGTFVVEE